MAVEAIQWKDRSVILIDQTLLPEKLTFLTITDYQVLGTAIKRLQVRGAPAIGIAAAYGIVLGIQHLKNSTPKSEFFDTLNRVATELKQTRPTAVNLFWAIDKMLAIADAHKAESIEFITDQLLAAAQAIHDWDRDNCRRIGEHGARLLKDGMTALTHCNAGALATGGIGTALGVFYTAAEAGKQIKVFADETRPLLQGARLTTWELMQAGIDVTLICDNMAAFSMQQHKIDIIIVGADRIAANGDTANKIGTYNLAVLAEKHQIPFYIAAPMSTFDFQIESGRQIPVEERAADEISMGFDKRTAPVGVQVYNPAFDITPHELIRGFITEKGILNPPFNSDPS